MNTRLARTSVATGAVVLGFLVGLAFPHYTAHAVTAQVNVNPGGTSGADYLTTSWHGAPSSLDWGRYGGGNPLIGTDVHWRSWSWRSDSGTPASLGTISSYTANGTCINVRADYLDSTGATVGSANYTHTYKSGSSLFYLLADNDWHYQSYSIAKVASAATETCDPLYWSGPHIHQNATSTFVQRTNYFVTVNSSYSITGQNDYQASRFMSW